MKHIQKTKRLGALVALLFALIPQVKAQEVDDLQDYLDQLASLQTESREQRSPRKGQGIEVPSGLTEVDLSKFTSYQNRTKTLTVKASVKFTNGTISAASNYSGGTCLLKIYGGATVVLDATAGINAGAASSTNCLAAVGIYEGSTFYECGDITAPGNGTGIAIYIDGASDTFNYVSGNLKGSISNEKGGTVNGLKEAYAVLSTNETTLSFYYDEKKSSRQGTIYTADQFRTMNLNGWGGSSSSITTVTFDSSFADYEGVTSTAYWFDDCSSLKTINGLSNLNTSNVTNMFRMFSCCSGLTNLDLSSFNTGNVTNMSDMFWFCSGLTSLNISSFNTSNVTNMWRMFCFCSRLVSLDISNFNTANVTDMSNMFSKCEGLITIQVGEGWNTNNVTSSDYMFNDCVSLVGGDGTKFNPNYTDKTKAYAGIGGYLTMEGQETSTDDLQTFINVNAGTGGVIIVDLSKFRSVIRDATLDICTGSCYCFINGTMSRSAMLNDPVIQISNGSTVEVGIDAIITGNDYYAGATVLLNGGTLNVTHGVIEGGLGFPPDFHGTGNPRQTPALQMTSPNDCFYLSNGTIYGPMVCDAIGADIKLEGGRIRGMGLKGTDRSNSSSNSRRRATPGGSREPYISSHSDIYINATTSENYTWGGVAPISGGEVSPEDNFDAFDIRLYDKSVIHLQKEYKSGFHITIYDGEEGDVVMEGDGYNITGSEINQMKVEVKYTNGPPYTEERQSLLKLIDNKVYLYYDDLQNYLNTLEDIRDYMFETSYYKQFKNTDWQSLYLPFDMNYEDWAEGFEVARFDGIDIVEGQPVLAATIMESGKVRANTPYLIRAKNDGSTSLSVSYSTVNYSVRSVSYSTDDATYTFTGNYEDMSGMFSARQYRMLGGWLAMPTSDSEELPPYRWYMTVEGTLPAATGPGLKLRIHSEDDTTVVNETENSKSSNSECYDLQGRKIQDVRQKRGIYIVNNKKIIK